MYCLGWLASVSCLDRTIAALTTVEKNTVSSQSPQFLVISKNTGSHKSMILKVCDLWNSCHFGIMHSANAQKISTIQSLHSWCRPKETRLWDKIVSFSTLLTCRACSCFLAPVPFSNEWPPDLNVVNQHCVLS